MDIKLPNLRHLGVFLAVCDFKSTTKASENIALSQPAVTQAIVKLEQRLHTQLFERHCDGMSLTDSGIVWQQRVIRALDLLSEAIQTILQERSNSTPLNLRDVFGKLSTTQLTALIAVCETQNFSRASRYLNVSQSSVHRAARDLERLLGVPLFDKNSLGIHSTLAANILAQASKLAFNELHQGIYEIHALHHHQDISTLRIGSTALARTAILPKAILKFAEKRPKANIKIVEGASQEDLLHQLRQGDIDILLDTLNAKVDDDLKQEPLWRPILSVVCNVNHLLLKKPIISPHDLANASWVVPVAGTSMRHAFDQLFQSGNINAPTQFVESSSHVLTYELLMESDRLALVATHQLDRSLRSGALKSLPFRLAHHHSVIGLYMRKSWLPTAAQVSFLDVLHHVADQLKD